MTRLTVFALEDPLLRVADTTDVRRIEHALSGIGIRYERWPAAAALQADADEAVVLASYGAEVDRLKAECGYQAADVVRLRRGVENAAVLRAKFLDEHVHDEDEVRFFVEGRGAFYLRSDQGVHRVICERGDLLSVPAGTRHWFDMGPDPEFTAIRLFTDPQGWVARFTGDPVARRMPEIDG
jgi:1,2-dihydroxy-3-keto-5-methylthiopentene dioxygenase